MTDTPERRKSGKYTTFQRFAYVPADQEMGKKIWRVPFPSTWIQKLKGFQRKYNLLDKGQPKSLPFSSLNSLLSLTIPTLITPGFQYLKKDDGSVDWRLLLIESPEKLFDPLTILVRIWIKYHFQKDIFQIGQNIDDALAELNDVIASFCETDFSCSEYNINLSRPELDPHKDTNGERIDGLFYKALPAWLVHEFANRVFKLGDYEFTLIHTQKPKQKDLGVELMSWPPRQLGRGFMSLYLDFDIETLPGKNVLPLIYPKWHVRRWINRPLTSKLGHTSLSYGRKVTIYVKGQIPWLTEAVGIKNAFTTTSIGVRKTDNGFQPTWEKDLNEILTIAGANWPALESAPEYAKRKVNFDVEPILAGVLGTQTNMSTHYPIGKGLFFRDIQDLMDQLHPMLIASGLSIAPTTSIKHIPLSGLGDTKDNVKVDTPIDTLDQTTQGKKRQVIEDALPDTRSLTIEIQYQDTETALILWNEIYKHFGFHKSFVETAPNIFSEPGLCFTTPENRQIKVIARPIKFNQLNVTDATPASYKSAVQDFARQLQAEFALPASDETIATFIELKNFNKETTKAQKAQDAKDASRYSYALIGRLTQFSEPVSATGDQSEQATRQNKAKAAVLDMRRQLGYIDTDLTKLIESTNLPSGLQLVGLHIYQKNSTRQSKTRGYQSVSFPVAVRLTVGERKVEALVPGENGEIQKINWLPYSSAALQLGIRSGKSAFANVDGERTDLPLQFLGRLFSLLENTPTILFVSGIAWRQSGLWEWLQDKKLVFDAMNVNNTIYSPANSGLLSGNTKSISGLRVVRYRTDEVPSYLALDLTREREEQAGYANGIVQISDRVFYSIAPKPTTNKKPYRFSRVGEGRSKDAQIPSLVEAVPVFMQNQDNTVDLVKIFHLLRAVVPHWKEGLITDPLPNHLAERLVSNYLVMRTLSELEDSDTSGDE